MAFTLFCAQAEDRDLLNYISQLDFISFTLGLYGKLTNDFIKVDENNNGPNY